MTTKPGRAWAAADLSLIQAAALLSGSSEWDSRPVPAASVPSFVMSDGPHGVRRQLGDGDHLGIAASEKATCFPTAATVANSWDPALAERMGEALGREARALGVDVLLGPGLNIKRSPLCGRNFEYYSEDPLLAGRMAAGMVRGIQSQGVAACPKHFAVNSQELRRMASDSVVDERTMREIYLTAFEIVVREASPRALMSSYNRVNGTYAHENAHLLTEILRSEWGFDGMVVSDWGGSNSAVDAARAGGSLEMPGPGLYGARQIVAAARAGELDEAAVRARAQEVLDMAAAAAALGEADPVDLDAHHELAVRIAQDSVVLLRNQGRTLPLAEGTGVGVVGDMARTPRYQGAGSSQVNPTRLESALDVLSDGAAGLAVEGFAQGYERQGGPDDQLIAEAVELASRCGTVLGSPRSSAPWRRRGPASSWSSRVAPPWRCRGRTGSTPSSTPTWADRGERGPPSTSSPGGRTRLAAWPRPTRAPTRTTPPRSGTRRPGRCLSTARAPTWATGTSRRPPSPSPSPSASG